MRAFLLCIIAIFIFSFQACIFNTNKNTNDDAIQLKLNFNPTHTYKYVKESKEVLQPEIKGTPITINQNMTVEASFQISPYNNGSKVLFSFSRIAIKSSNDIITLEYDSKDPTKQGQDIFHNIPLVLNKQKTATIANDGTITVAPQNEVVDSNSAAQVQLTDFSDSALHSMLEQLFNFYPGHTIKLGDSWKTRSDVYVSFIKMQSDNNYKLTALSGNLAHLEINSNLTSNSTLSNHKQFRGTQTGEMEIDINSGLILDCKLSRNIEGYMDSAVHATIKSDIHITGREN